MAAIGIDTSMIGGDMERGGELRRYMFAIELNGTIGTKTEKGAETSNTYTWKPENAASMYKKIPCGNDEYDAIRQTLVIRRIILGPSAKEGEANWLFADVKDPDGSDTKFPLALLTKGSESQTMVDLAFPDARDIQVKFSLEEGTGPVHVVGYHLIERIQFDNQEECEEEEEVDEEELEDLEEGKQVPQRRLVMRVNGSGSAPRKILATKRGITRDGNESGDVAAAKKIKTAEDDEAMEDAAAVAANGNSK